MICPQCQSQNREQAKFCKRCGLWLLDRCPHCGEALPDLAIFCDQCGYQVSASLSLKGRELTPGPIADNAHPAPAAPESHQPPVARKLPVAPASFAPPATGQAQGTVGERRIITMLFCDVTGSTAAAEQLDPEEWQEIINQAFERMIRPVHAYGGAVARLMGDAVLAFFGAPSAHEDDPQRAVLAGLDIIAGIEQFRQDVMRRWGIDFKVRVGINTGMVVVGAVGSDLHVEYTAVGDAINVAARMEQTAAPGTVQIAHATYQQVAPFFEVEALGGIQLKGKSERIPSYRVIRPKEALGRRAGDAAQASALVGRQREFEQLRESVQGLEVGKGGVGFVIGEAGLGKSRLMAETRAFTAASYPAFAWVEVASVSYETAQPYHLIRRLLRAAAGVRADDADEALERIENILGGAGDDERAQMRRVVQTLFGLEDDSQAPRLEGETFRGRLYVLMESFWRAWSDERPTVLLFEDLHWADPASVELISRLFAICEEAPLLFLCAMRPERETPGWASKIETEDRLPHRFFEIDLQPLSADESTALVDNLLVDADLPERLRASILDKTAGNPLFVEEVVRSLAEGGALSAPAGDLAMTLDIPDNLQALLVSRIDRLPARARRTLQLASVLGRTFNYRVLARVGDASDGLEDDLQTLQRGNLIQEIARRPERAYSFRHALMQEAAYRTILRSQRRRYHQAAGEAIEALFAAQVEDYAGVLANHFSLAGDQARALKYHMQAGDIALRLHARIEAVEHYSQALEIAKTFTVGAEQRIHLYLRRGRALELDGRLQEAVNNYKAMRAEAEGEGEDRMLLAALAAMATQYSTPTSISDLERGAALSDQALKLAQALEDRAAEAKILWNLLNMYRQAGQPDRALACGKQSLAIARELDLREQMAYSLNDLCHVYNGIGRYDLSKAALEESTALWRELDNLPMLADSLSTSSYVYTYTGDFDQAIAFSNAALSLSESIDSVWGMSYSRYVVGIAFWERGRPEQAIQAMQASVRLAKDAGFLIAQVYTRTDLAMVYADLGDLVRAMEIVNQASALAESGHAQFAPYTYAHRARFHLMMGDLSAAERDLESMHANGHSYNLVQPDMTTLAECELALKQGDHATAAGLLQQRAEALRGFGMRVFLPETLRLLASAQKADGHTDMAMATLREGLAEAEIMQARRSQWRILADMAQLTGGEQAEEWRAEARRMASDIADSLSAPYLQQCYLALPAVQAVLNKAQTSQRF